MTLYDSENGWVIDQIPEERLKPIQARLFDLGCTQLRRGESWIEFLASKEAIEIIQKGFKKNDKSISAHTATATATA